MDKTTSINSIRFSDCLLSQPSTPQKVIEKFDLEQQGEHKPRPKWGKGIEFLLSCISLSVGLGNIWRFPYTAYKNGGGTFLIPYLIVLFFVGKPFYFLEMILGQFTSQGSMKAIQAVPLLKGVGWGQQVASATIATYYSAIIALILAYVIKSFAVQLPWSTCEEFEVKCFPAEALGQIANFSAETKSSAELFLNIKILNKTDDITEGIGWPVQGMAICLIISWVCVYISIVKGIKTSGKFSYIFAILPYFILTTILIRACFLDGAIDGIKYFLFPGGSNWRKLFDLNVWFDATTQCFFSLTIGMGAIIMFSSYNEFDRNIYKDAAIVSLMDTLTSMLGGVTIFAILGNLAKNLQQDIDKVVKDSMGLAFITYPEAISKFAKVLGNIGYWPQVMAIFFFGMLFVLGVGSVVGLLSNLTTNLKDYFPKLKYWKLALIGTVSGCSIGLVYVTPGGFHILGLVDLMNGQVLVFVLAIAELLGIVWVYGLENLCWDLEFMLKRKVSPYWRLSWFLIMPTFLLSMFAYWLIQISKETLRYGEQKLPFPPLVLGVVWSLFIIGLGQVIIAIVYISMKKRDKSTLKYLTTQNPEWGPKNLDTRIEWIAFKTTKLREREEIVAAHGHSWLQQKYWLLMGKYP